MKPLKLSNTKTFLQRRKFVTLLPNKYKFTYVWFRCTLYRSTYRYQSTASLSTKMKCRYVRLRQSRKIYSTYFKSLIVVLFCPDIYPTTIIVLLIILHTSYTQIIIKYLVSNLRINYNMRTRATEFTPRTSRPESI